MEQHVVKSDTESRDMLMAIGGVALVVMGVGLIMSHPFVRRYLGSQGIGGMMAHAIPDIERYLKLRSM